LAGDSTYITVLADIRLGLLVLRIGIMLTLRRKSGDSSDFKKGPQNCVILFILVYDLR
jgi:hypothetical protein